MHCLCLIYPNNAMHTNVKISFSRPQPNQYLSYSPYFTRMGDRLWAGKPSRYVTNQLGRLSLLPFYLLLG